MYATQCPALYPEPELAVKASRLYVTTDSPNGNSTVIRMLCGNSISPCRFKIKVLGGMHSLAIT